MAEHFTIAEASALIQAKKLSPVELTRICLERTAQLDQTIHAYICQTPERALAEAHAAEARIMAGRSRGPLDGIPIAHKDIYCTKGLSTTAHSKILQDHVPDEDAVVVTKWQNAGLIMHGKLSTHEFAMGGPSFDLPWPPARNPWDPTRFTSGSSSGTGAGVAAGLFLGGTGSDTGGSIRGPAAFCGIAGIKPTYGLCSRRGVLPLSFTLDHTGPMAWTAQDCAMLLQAMAGYDPQDPASADRPVPDFTSDLHQGAKGLRIGVVRKFHETDNRADPAVLRAIEDAIAIFRTEGAEVRDVALPSLNEYRAAGFVILMTEAYAVHEQWMRTRLGDYGELLRDGLLLGAALTGADYFQAVRRRRELCVATARAMQGLDLLLTTAAPTEAPPIENLPKWRLMESPSFTMPFNVTGLPAIAVCAGFGDAGLPVSIQVVGHPFAEQTVFRAVHAYETATEWRKRRPAMVF
jgi:aspartyl-tRNA(Asn)/glutamyl-tRNA(Gln) amidotransferase subunit A